MKIRAILISALIVCCISAAFMYTRAAQSTNESKMIERAIQGKNTSQLIKALIGKMKDQLEVNDDDFPALIKEVENYAAECKDPASAAVLHSMVAEMYNNYYIQNRWKINQRTGRLRSRRYTGMDFQSFHPKGQRRANRFPATGRAVTANAGIRFQGNPRNRERHPYPAPQPIRFPGIPCTGYSSLDRDI